MRQDQVARLARAVVCIARDEQRAVAAQPWAEQNPRETDTAVPANVATDVSYSCYDDALSCNGQTVADNGPLPSL